MASKTVDCFVVVMQYMGRDGRFCEVRSDGMMHAWNYKGSGKHTRNYPSRDEALEGAIAEGTENLKTGFNSYLNMRITGFFIRDHDFTYNEPEEKTA